MMLAAGVLFGLIARCGWFTTSGLVAFVPMLWGLAETRYDAWFFIFVYYLILSSDLFSGIGVFFKGQIPFEVIPLIWVGIALLLSLPWALLYTQNRKPTMVMSRLFLVFFLITVPPLGVVGWGNPMACAGWLFPGMGFWGILFLVLTDTAVICSEKKALPVGVFAVCFCLGMLMPAPDSEFRHHWQAVNTSYGEGAFKALKLYNAVRKIKSEFILTPELIAGVWDGENKDLWMRAAKPDRTLVIGVTEPDGDSYNNSMIFLGKNKGVYRQRMPVPGAMWKPEGYNARWLDPGLVETADGRLYVGLLCYEMFMSWPVVWSFINAPRTPDLILAAGNHWWSEDGYLRILAVKMTDAWARLFGVPYVMAMNY